MSQGVTLLHLAGAQPPRHSAPGHNTYRRFAGIELKAGKWRAYTYAKVGNSSRGKYTAQYCSSQEEAARQHAWWVLHVCWAGCTIALLWVGPAGAWSKREGKRSEATQFASGGRGGALEDKGKRSHHSMPQAVLCWSKLQRSRCMCVWRFLIHARSMAPHIGA